MEAHDVVDGSTFSRTWVSTFNRTDRARRAPCTAGAQFDRERHNLLRTTLFQPARRVPGRRRSMHSVQPRAASAPASRHRPQRLVAAARADRHWHCVAALLGRPGGRALRQQIRTKSFGAQGTPSPTGGLNWRGKTPLSRARRGLLRAWFERQIKRLGGVAQRLTVPHVVGRHCSNRSCQVAQDFGE